MVQGPGFSTNIKEEEEEEEKQEKLNCYLHTIRYGLLRRTSSNSCGGLRPTDKVFFFI